MKNYKMFINFVSTITFFSFPVRRKFWYQIVAGSMCFPMIYIYIYIYIIFFEYFFYRFLFLEDTCSNIKVTQKVYSITGTILLHFVV